MEHTDQKKPLRPLGQDRIVRYLDTLAHDAPNSLLLEGGNGAARFELALYWTGLLNCQEPSPPCSNCPTCLQIREQVFRDMEIIDGRDSQILIADVRKVKGFMGQSPSGAGKRVIILAGAQNMDLPAANVLLKSMEEPGPGNVFVLLTPQRGNLLPTLVSRSFVLTLPWPKNEEPAEDILEWEQAFVRFLDTGQDWFVRTGKKNSVDANLAKKMLLRYQRGVVHYSQKKDTTPLSAYLVSRQNNTVFDRLEHILSHGLDALEKRTNPALVMDWTAVRFWETLQAKE
ncbi:DNA polymerase III subunit delta' [Desulfoplanes sp.]